jgi:hypothetical protein
MGGAVERSAEAAELARGAAVTGVEAARTEAARAVGELQGLRGTVVRAVAEAQAATATATAARAVADAVRASIAQHRHSAAELSKRAPGRATAGDESRSREYHAVASVGWEDVTDAALQHIEALPASGHAGTESPSMAPSMAPSMSPAPAPAAARSEHAGIARPAPVRGRVRLGSGAGGVIGQRSSSRASAAGSVGSRGTVARRRVGQRVGLVSRARGTVSRGGQGNV